MNIQEKYEKLQENLHSLNRVAIGFTGGVDSTFLLKTAVDTLGSENVLAITIDSILLPRRELEYLKSVIKKLKVKHIIVKVKPIEEILENPVDRCYHCKKYIISLMLKTALEYGIKTVVDASIVDDLSDYRPGLKALEEGNIRTPLLDIGFTKKDIRFLSKQLDLETWDKPSESCLATRIPYGTRITEEFLEMIEDAEGFLYSLGVRFCRVRLHCDDIARIETSIGDMAIIMENRESIISSFKKFGFKYITLDLEGYRSGSMNELIT